MGNNVDVAPFFNVLLTVSLVFSFATDSARDFLSAVAAASCASFFTLHTSSQFHQALLSHTDVVTHTIAGVRTNEVCVRRAYRCVWPYPRHAGVAPLVTHELRVHGNTPD
jgi:hypothetical protein